MCEPLVVIDTSQVREGKLEELQAALAALVEFVEANEPRVLAYNIYLNGDGSEMIVLQVHPDSASMEFHMTVAGPAFPQFGELVELRTMDVYGRPSENLLELLRRKVRMLGDATVEVHEPHAGFARLGSYTKTG